MISFCALCAIVFRLQAELMCGDEKVFMFVLLFFPLAPLIRLLQPTGHRYLHVPDGFGRWDPSQANQRPLEPSPFLYYFFYISATPLLSFSLRLAESGP
jgi:hypothetical protein